MEFGYRLLRGRGGASGFVRGMGERVLLSIQGMNPGDECALYALRSGQGVWIARQAADRDGRAQWMAEAEGSFFVTVNGRVTLWEDDEDAEARYLLACSWVQREKEEQSKQSYPETEGENTPLTGKKTPAEPEEQPAIIAEQPLTSLPEARVDTAVSDEKKNEQEAAEPPVSQKAPDAIIEKTVVDPLRFPGSGEPVNGLPALRWPAGMEDLLLNFALRPPFAPFDAPDWRFVRLPSPLPEAAYCAVGYRAEEDQVVEIAYAIPGRSDHPPVSLPGYHYRPGRTGNGYWVTTRRA